MFDTLMSVFRVHVQRSTTEWLSNQPAVSHRTNHYNCSPTHATQLQEPTLFATTVYENIAIGRSGASEAEVHAAAQAANAHK